LVHVYDSLGGVGVSGKFVTRGGPSRGGKEASIIIVFLETTLR